MRSLFSNLARTRYSHPWIEPLESYSQSPTCSKCNIKQGESRARFLKRRHRFSNFSLVRGIVVARSMESSSKKGPFVQNLFVMRHGERMDNYDPEWIRSAPRPWDPPLTDAGKKEARETGERLRTQGWNITRVICSPFLRCIQTAAEVVTALCAVQDHPLAIDPSKVKVSIEYGLCEVMNYIAIRTPPSSPDVSWILDHSELEAILPAGTVDHSVERIWPELPHWPEKTEKAHERYTKAIQALADKYPQENVLCVTHELKISIRPDFDRIVDGDHSGEGVGVSVSTFKKDVIVHAVEYCAYSHSQRSIFDSSTNGLNAEKFHVLTESGQSGIRFVTSKKIME